MKKVSSRSKDDKEKINFIENKLRDTKANVSSKEEEYR